MLRILGDSHTLALEAGRAEQCAASGEANGDVQIAMLFPGHLPLAPFFACTKDVVVFLDEDTREVLRRVTGRSFLGLADRAAIFAFSLGLVTTNLLRAWAREPFAPWSTALADRDRPVSDAVVESIALAHNEHVLSFFARVTELGIRCLAIAGPPPRRTETALADGASAATVLEVDRSARRAVAAELERIGVGVVWPPEEAFDGAPGRSFLREELGAPDDTHHGNARYGRMMFERVLARAETLRPWLLLRPLGPDPSDVTSGAVLETPPAAGHRS